MESNRSRLNFFERCIAVVSPKWALTRAASRERLTIFDRKRTYEGGRPNRSTAGWKTPAGSSPNTEIKFDLTWLRERSRDLVRNNPYAKKAVAVITTNTVGTGIRPSIPKGEISQLAEKKLMAAFRAWADTTECDYDGQFNLYGLMMQAWRASVESGDAIIRVMRDPNSNIPVKLQLLEADYLDHQRDGQVTGEGNRIVLGVEFDRVTNKRVAYWLYKNHPYENNVVVGDDRLSVRVPADEIIHLYEVLRPGQVRGIPHGVSSFIRIKNLDEYEDAQLVRQKIAACFSVFIQKADPDYLDHAGNSPKDSDLPPLGEKLSPGIIEYLAPGEDVKFANPPGTTGYDTYTRGLIRSIATAYLVTYESVSGDLSSVNFSSGRMGWLEAHRQVQQWQAFAVITLFCQPVWKHFLLGAKLRGIYSGGVITARWTPPRREMIDPVKEAHGLQMLIRAGLSSKAETIRELGLDPEKLFAEIMAEQNEADAAKMMFESDPKWDATRVNFGIEAYLAKFKQQKDTSEKKSE